MIEVADGGTEEWFVDPEDLGLERARRSSAIAGGEPEENAAVVRAVLAGEPGPARDVVVLNAAAAILVGGGADDLPAGVDRAARGDRLGRRARRPRAARAAERRAGRR